MEVGIRQLRNNLSEYLDLVGGGGEVVITDRGRAVARLVPMAGGRTMDQLIAEGLVTPPTVSGPRRVPRPVKGYGPVSDLVAEQRR
jgi:prevent-host-death family protein